MIEDPEWWAAFEYKLSMVVFVFSSLTAIAIGIWKLSRRYSVILTELKSKVSHTEMEVCKQEITSYIETATEKLNRELKSDIKADHSDNSSDHSRIEGALQNLTNLFVNSLKGK